MPGTISLHVEVVPPHGTPRGAIFLIAGGPGQGSAHVFGLDDASAVDSTASSSPATRSSPTTTAAPASPGLLDCPAAPGRDHADEQSARPPRRAPSDRAAAATSTRPPTHAEDLEAVRRRSASTRSRSTASRTARSSRWRMRSRIPTTSSGCCSTRSLPPELPDPYSANDAARDAGHARRVLLGRRLPRRDEELRRRRGRRRERAGGEAARRARCCRRTAETTTVASTASSFLVDRPRRRPQPRRRRRAAGGRPRRARRQHAAAAAARLPARQRQLRSRRSTSASALYAATVCRDGPFPWAPDTPARAAPGDPDAPRSPRSPPGTFGPFGKWAARLRERRLLPRLAEPVRRRRARAGTAARTCPCSRSAAASTCARRPTAPRRSSRASRRASCSSSRASATARPPRTSRAARSRSVHAWMLGGSVAGSALRPQALVPPIPALPARRPGEARQAARLAADLLDCRACARGRRGDLDRCRRGRGDPRHLGRQAHARWARVHAHPLRDREGRRRQRKDPADLDGAAAALRGDADRDGRRGRDRAARPQGHEPARHARRANRREVAR